MGILTLRSLMSLIPTLTLSIWVKMLTNLTAVDETAPTTDLAAIDAISDQDTGSVGGDSKVDDGISDGSSGTSFMTWVMYIGGAILVMALVAGACYIITQNKDANEFSHEQ